MPSHRRGSGVCVCLLAVALAAIAADAPVPRQVRLQQQWEQPLPVGRPVGAACFGDQLFAPLAGSGLWVWRVPTAEGPPPAPTRIDTFGEVQQVFGLGDAVGVRDQGGLLFLNRAAAGGWEPRRLLPQANLGLVVPLPDRQFFILAGERADLYAYPPGAETLQLVCSWNSRQYCATYLSRLAKEDPDAARETKINVAYAALAPPLLLLDLGGQGVCLLTLDANRKPTSFDKLSCGHVVAATPYHGCLLVAASGGLFLVPPPVPRDAAADPELRDPAGETLAGPRPTGEPLRLYPEAIGWFALTDEQVVFLAQGQLLALPRRVLEPLATRLTGADATGLDEAPAVKQPPAPTLLAKLPPKTPFALGPDGRTLFWVSDGAVLGGPLTPAVAARRSAPTLHGGPLTPGQSALPAPRYRFAGVSTETPLALGADFAWLGLGNVLRRFEARTGQAPTDLSVTWENGTGQLRPGQVASNAVTIRTLLAADGALLVAWQPTPGTPPAAAGRARFNPGTLAVEAVQWGPLVPGERAAEQVLSEWWPAGDTQMLARTAANDALYVLDARTLTVSKTLPCRDGFRPVAAQVVAGKMALLGQLPPAAPKGPVPFVCGLFPTATATAWPDVGPRPEWFRLDGGYGAHRPVVADDRVFLVTRDGYRPPGYCLGPGPQAIEGIVFLGGVLDAAVSDGLAFVARGLYGLTVHDLNASSQFLFAGGVSAPDTVFYRVAVGAPQRVAAFTGRGLALYTWALPPAPGPLPVAGQPDPRRPVLTDDGVDVTSWDYTNLRGYATPLTLELGAPPPGQPHPHGVVYADPKANVAVFPPARPRPVRLRAECPLPHSGGVLAAFDRNTLLVGGNEGMNFEWWDITDPAQPTLLNRVEPSVGPPVQFEVRDRIVYLISNIWGGGFYIYDLTDLRRPVKLGGRVGLGKRHSSFCLVGDRAYVRLRDPGATIVTADVALPPAGPDGARAYRDLPVLSTFTLPLAKAAALPTPVAAKGPAPDPIKVPDEDENTSFGADLKLPPPDRPVVEDLIEGDPRPMLLYRDHLFVSSAWTGEKTKTTGCALFVLPVTPAGVGAPVWLARQDVHVTSLGLWADRLYVVGVTLPPPPPAETEPGAAAPAPPPSRVVIDTYDLTQLTQPRRLSRWEAPPGQGLGHAVFDGAHLWCTLGDQTKVFSLAEAQPREAASHQSLEPIGQVWCLAEQRLYIQDVRAGVTIFDVADVKTPRRLGRVLAADGWGGGIDVWRGYAYVGPEGGNIDQYKLQILDVRQPLQPRLVEILDPLDRCCTPLAWGDYLWLSSATHPAVADLAANPVTPPIIAEVKEQPGGIIQGRGFRPFRDLVASGFGSQLRLLRVTPQRQVETVSVLPDVGGTATLAASHDYIYWGGVTNTPVGDLAVTVKVINLQTVTRPEVVATLRFPGYHTSASLEYRDGFLFLWLERNGGWVYPGFWGGYGSHGWLATIDVREPTRPQVVSMYPAPCVIDSLSEMRLDGDLLYFAAYMSNHLGIVDVSDPVHPVDVTAWRHWAPFYYVGDIDIDGDYGYLTTPYSVEVLDVPLSGQAPRGPLAWQPAAP